jgi:ChrR Cupin-like domain
MVSRRCVPSSKFPAHTHVGGEEFLVLEGTFKDQGGAYPAGTYVRNPIGSEHEPWVDEDGCIIMVKLLQMAEDREGCVAPLYVDLAKARTEDSNDVSYGQVSELYRNDQTGEVVEVCWLEADRTFNTDWRSDHGGEELFVVDGSINLAEEEFRRWDWLRFPVGSTKERPTLKSGPNGALVYRKTGHLTDMALSMEKIRIGNDESVIT